MSIEEIVHPEDARALKVLMNVPALPKVMEKVFEYGYDEISWMENLSTNLRLSESQMPEIYNHLPPICKRLGIPVPELYLQMSPTVNAWTSGHHKVYIVLTLGLIKKIHGEELDAVLAHECGHILCQHVLYQTLANAIFSFGDSNSDSIVGVLGNVAMKPVRQALVSWSRASELTADRVACVLTSAETLSRALARIDMIPRYIVDNMDVKEWACQGKDFEAMKKGTAWNKIVHWLSNSDAYHPFSPIRAYEAMTWEKTDTCKRLKDNPSCLNLEIPESFIFSFTGNMLKKTSETAKDLGEKAQKAIPEMATGIQRMKKDATKTLDSLAVDKSFGNVLSKFGINKNNK